MQQFGLNLPTNPPTGGAVTPYTPPVQRPVNFGGTTMESVSSMIRRRTDEAKAKAASAASQAVIQGLAGYIKDCWSKAYTAKLPVERKMLKALRARRGEYDPEKVAQIRKQGGSEIFMMLTSVKSRQATALLRDTLIGSGSGKPWSLDPSVVPELSQEQMEKIMGDAANAVAQIEASGVDMPMEDVRQLLRDARDKAMDEVEREAKDQAHRMEKRMEDDMAEGGWTEALDQVLDDLMTFKTVFLKGPVVRNRKKLKWVTDETGKPAVDVQDTLVKEWERVDPFDIYPAPWAKDTNDSWVIERHHLSRGDIAALIGVEGYSEDAIRAVLDDFDKGRHDLLMIDSQKALAEGREGIQPAAISDLIDAMQFWGSVSGKMLLDWGMKAEQVPDVAQQYEVEVWLIGPHVIKAALNTDPLLRRPYFSTGYERVPGAFWHNSLFDLIEDCQDMCNAAGRSLANNLGIASGPQVVVNIDRIPVNEEITQLYPWKIHQVTSDPMGSTAPAISFFQPTSNSTELLGVYEKFSQLADEYSGIPKYMTGTEGTPGAGRTATGLNMMIGNASKTIKQVVANIDLHIIKKSVERDYLYNMRYGEDDTLKGDVQVSAKGALGLGVKESMQQRRNEFLQVTANPVDLQIIGQEGRAYMLREAAKSMDMDVDKVVPSATALKAKAAQAAQAQAEMAAQQQAAGGAPPGQPGAVPGLEGPQSKELMNGAPVADAFSAAPQ